LDLLHQYYPVDLEVLVDLLILLVQEDLLYLKTDLLDLLHQYYLGVLVVLVDLLILLVQEDLQYLKMGLLDLLDLVDLEDQ